MKDLLESSDSVAWDSIGIGVLVSFFSAYLCIRLFLMFIRRVCLLPFVAYLLALGLILLSYLYNVGEKALFCCLNLCQYSLAPDVWVECIPNGWLFQRKHQFL